MDLTFIKENVSRYAQVDFILLANYVLNVNQDVNNVLQKDVSCVNKDFI